MGSREIEGWDLRKRRVPCRDMAPRCAQKQDHETEDLDATCMGLCRKVSAKSVVHAYRTSDPRLEPEKDVGSLKR